MNGKIKIFISSRCNDLLTCKDGDIEFSELRKYIKDNIIKEQILGVKPFEVILSEDFVEDAEENWFDKCLREINESNLSIVLFSGNAGFKYQDTGNTGICHAEFTEIYNKYGNKTYVIDLLRKSEETLKYLKNSSYIDYNNLIKEKRHKAFKKYFYDKQIISPNIAKSKKYNVLEFKEEILKNVKIMIFNGIVKSLNQSKNVKKKLSIGETLEWSKMSYKKRQSIMKDTATKIIDQNQKMKKLNYLISVIPDSMSIAEARELIGRPFLNDHTRISKTKKLGIIHFIVIFKNITENGIRKYIGHPDITIIEEKFGYYIWDHITHIQILAIKNCRDTSIIGVQFTRLMNWLKESGEYEKIKERSKKRHNILKVIKDNYISED